MRIALTPAKFDSAIRERVLVAKDKDFSLAIPQAAGIARLSAKVTYRAGRKAPRGASSSIFRTDRRGC
jgi:hypothetical protein